MSSPIITIQRRGRAVRISLVDGGRVGDFRNEQAGLDFTRRTLGAFQVQQEFNFNSARGAGLGRNLTVSSDDSARSAARCSTELAKEAP